MSLDDLKKRYDAALRVKRGTATKLANAQSADNNAQKELAEAEKAYTGAMTAEAARLARS